MFPQPSEKKMLNLTQYMPVSKDKKEVFFICWDLNINKWLPVKNFLPLHVLWLNDLPIPEPALGNQAQLTKA